MMTHSYTPRKKHPEMPVRAMKLVRVDARTQIEVPITVSDADAITRFRNRYESYSHYSGQGTPTYVMKDQITEIPMGTVEELATMLDDANVPDPE
jgi:hypothetical protein